MNEKKVLGTALLLGVVGLTVVFILLFIYVGVRYLDVGGKVVDPIHTVLATAAMVILGFIVYVKRNRNKQNRLDKKK